MPTMSLSTDSAFAILLKIRSHDATSRPAALEQGDPPGSAGRLAALAFEAEDQARLELFAAIRELNEDEQLDLITLIWIGRGDFTFAEWAVARYAATSIGCRRTARYVAGIPQGSHFLEEGLSLFHVSLAEYLDRH